MTRLCSAKTPAGPKRADLPGAQVHRRPFIRAVEREVSRSARRTKPSSSKTAASTPRDIRSSEDQGGPIPPANFTTPDDDFASDRHIFSSGSVATSSSPGSRWFSWAASGTFFTARCAAGTLKNRVYRVIQNQLSFTPPSYSKCWLGSRWVDRRRAGYSIIEATVASGSAGRRSISRRGRTRRTGRATADPLTRAKRTNRPRVRARARRR
jgi:hypothetical protein